jgi:hypothetical protein
MLNRKGRSKKEYITIEDEAITPYIIKIDEDNYTIAHINKPEQGLYFCASLHTALKRIVRLTNSATTKTQNIKEYIANYNNMLNQFKKNIEI